MGLSFNLQPCTLYYYPLLPSQSTMPPYAMDTVATPFPTDLKIVEKAKVLPIVHDAVSAAVMLHTQVRDCNTVYNTVEDFVVEGIKEAGPTITGTITNNVPEAVMTTVATAVDQLDTLACRGLDQLTTTIPQLNTPTKEIANKINDATGYVAKPLGLGKIIAWLLDTFYINFFLINIFGMKLVEVSAETETVVTETAETMKEPEQMRDEMEASEMMAVETGNEERAEMAEEATPETAESMEEPEQMRDEMDASEMMAMESEEEERAEMSAEDEPEESSVQEVQDIEVPSVEEQAL